MENNEKQWKIMKMMNKEKQREAIIKAEKQ